MKAKLYRNSTEYTPKLLDILDKFGMGPKIELTETERDILDVISQIDDAGFYDLCECFDMKPSKMEKRLIDLEEQGLVEYMDAAGKVRLTPISMKLLAADDDDSRAERKFRRFIESLTEEELDRFAELADAFEIDEELVSAADDSGKSDNFVIIDDTEAETDEPSEDNAEAAETAAVDADSESQDEQTTGV